MPRKKICIVSGSRAEFGLLRFVIEGVKNSSILDLQLIVTGMHLSVEHGLTYKEIEECGFNIDKKIETVLASDTSSSITKSVGLGLIGCAQSFEELSPDCVVILGDRYEVFACALAALFFKIPIVHIHGGELTRASFDDAIRHSITKMSWFHLVASEVYKDRVIQLGENPKNILNVGGLGVDAIKKLKLLNKSELKQKKLINFGKKNLLITFHPSTLDVKSTKSQIENLVSSLEKLENCYLIFTMPNSDPDSKIIKSVITNFVQKNKKRAIAFESLGQRNYLSVLQFVDGVVGNSSSGLLEAPSFKIGTINIGNRQDGRLKSKSVIDCDSTKESITVALKQLFSNDFKKRLKSVKNPYGEGNASIKIIKFLEKVKIPINIEKRFFDIC